MAGTTWQIRGIDTLGQDLVLRQIAPWSATGLVVPTAVTSTFPPISGAVENLIVDDSTECRFAAEDVQKPGFCIEFYFSTPVEPWGFRFAGPSADTWSVRHTVVVDVLAAALERARWLPGGVLSPAPTRKLNFNEAGQWVVQAPLGSANWFGCAMSADGGTLLVSAVGGTLWLSKNAGSTWVSQTTAGVQNWGGCAASSDGSTLLAVAADGVPSLSKNGGATWVSQTTLGSRTWRNAAMSADGNTMLITAFSGTPWLSKDAGETWVAQTTLGTATWFGSGVSADGKTLLCAAQGGTLRLSKDAGATWVAQTSAGSRLWRGCAVSADGMTLIAVDSTSTPWLSKDAGTTWVAQVSAGSRDWYDCAASADGRTLLAVAANTEPWVSKDAGATWVVQAGAGSAAWAACSLTQTGDSLLAVQYGGNVKLATGRDPIYLNVPMQALQVRPLSVIRGSPQSAQELGPITRTATPMVRDMEFGGNGRVYGTVERKNTPANVPMRRRVRLHRSRDGMLVRETWSKADGTYEFNGISTQYEYDTIAWDNELSYRSVVANNLKPEAM